MKGSAGSGYEGTAVNMPTAGAPAAHDPVEQDATCGRDKNFGKVWFCFVYFWFINILTFTFFFTLRNYRFLILRRAISQDEHSFQ